MKSIMLGASLVFAVSSCATNVVPTPVDGQWNLVGVRCQSGKAGKLAKDDRKGIDTKQLEEFMVIKGGKVEQHFLERSDGSNLAAYCETVYSLQWTLSDGVIHSSGSTFESREGRGGYKCYEPFPRVSQSSMPDLPFRIEGDRLITSHKDIQLKDRQGHTQRECKSGSDVDHIYQKQN